MNRSQTPTASADEEAFEATEGAEMANPRTDSETDLNGKGAPNGSGANGQAKGASNGAGRDAEGSSQNVTGDALSPEYAYSESTLAATGPLSPYDDDLSTLSSLPAPRVEDTLQVWEPPSPTAWRKNAVSHAGSAILGGIVAVGAFIAFGPKRVVHIKDPRPLVANVPPQAAPGIVPGLDGMNNAVPFGPQGPGVNGTGPALPPGAKPIPNAAANGVPNVQPGTGVPVPPANPSGSRTASVNLPQGGGSIPPLPKGVTLPPLTSAPPPVLPAKGLPPLPPGLLSSANVGRPPAAMMQPGPSGSIPLPPVKNSKVKGQTAPPYKAGTTISRVIGPPQSSGTANEDTDQSIDRLKRAAEANPKDAVAQLQLEKAYRKKLIQADRVDEMEHYRSLADDARDKARTILSSDSAKPAPKAPGANTPAPPAEPKPAPKPADSDPKPAASDTNGKPATPPS